jgi:hypothetical protein
MKLPRPGACALLVLLAACGNSTPPPRDAAPADASAAPTPTPTPPPTQAAPVADAGAATDAGAEPAVDAGPEPDAGAVAAAPFAPDNKVAPTSGPELLERARGLFDAIVKDEPERGEAFWFPKEPFIPLKDVKEPGKYWTQLHRTYVNDIHALHAKRKSWERAELLGFDGWSHPKWVKPGDEANKIGYYRAFRGKLRYRIDGEDAEIEVRTIITWQGRWFITHLSKFKK